MNPIVVLVITFLSGGAFGSIIALTFSHRRDTASRRCDFLAFICEWRSEIAMNVPENCEWPHSPFVQHWFSDRIPRFVERVERARSVFCASSEFGSLTDNITKLTNKDWKQREPRHVILEAIDALIEETRKYAA